MDNLMYMASLVLVASLAFAFYKTNNTLLMILSIAVGGYIIFSHETGHTATEFKNSMVESIDTSTGKFVGKYESENNSTNQRK